MDGLTTQGVDRRGHERSDILSGLRAELEASSKPSSYTVVELQQAGPVWRITADISEDKKGPGLDESMEDATAWWPADPRRVWQQGAADVLSVLPDQQEIHLRYASTPPPGRAALSPSIRHSISKLCMTTGQTYH